MKTVVKRQHAFRLARRLTIVSMCLAVFTACSAEEPHVQVDPAVALDDFYSYDGAEDTLMDPLIVAGNDVVPLVLEQIVKADMVKRRYAIQALGNIGDASAIPTLKLLAESESEPGYIRCVSTQSVAHIDWNAGRELAQGHIQSGEQELPECLPRVSKQILTFSREEWLANTGIVRTLEDAGKRKHY